MTTTHSNLKITPQATRLADQAKKWRRAIHKNPELAFNEHHTAQFVVAKLQEFGLEVESGLAGTGVVAKLVRGNSPRAIALRADMDALAISEKTNLPYASGNDGVMHACGHDGHTAMLLGAAKALSEDANFNGTAYFIFQPAEENEGGGRTMIEAGLFGKVKVEAVFGMHNWPGLPVGQMAMRAGPQMAAVDTFELHISGRGAHVAMPHLGDDPIVAIAEFVAAAQTIVSRRIDPAMSAVLSFSSIVAHSEARNIIPATATAAGTARFFEPTLGDFIRDQLNVVAQSIGSRHGVEAKIDYRTGYPPVINDASATQAAADAASAVVGSGNVLRDFPPSLGCEDFAFMLREKPGCYVWLGAGPDDNGRCLHSAHYDFNDQLLPIGISYWQRLVEQQLPS